MNPFRNNLAALAKGASSGEVPVPGSIPRSPCQGRLCRAPCPHPRLRQLGRSCFGCRLAAGSCLSPATAEPAWNILLANPPLCRSLPREGGRERLRCRDPSPPGPGGLSEIPQPGDAFKASAAALSPGMLASGLGFAPTPCDSGAGHVRVAGLGGPALLAVWGCREAEP